MSNAYQMPLVQVDRLHRLGVVERVLRRVFGESTPTRPTLIAMCESGILEGKQIGLGKNWFVYESSLNAFILDSQQPRQQKLAA